MNGTCRTFDHSVVAPIDIAMENYQVGRSGGTDLLYIGQSVRHAPGPKIALAYSGKPASLSHLFTGAHP